MSSSASEEELLIYPPYQKCTGSAESVITQKIAKLTKSESLFKFHEYNPNLTFSQLKLRETHLRNFREKAQKLELAQEKCTSVRTIQTKSLLMDELEMLKINMSVQDKLPAVRESQMGNDLKNREKKWKRGKKIIKLEGNFPLAQNCVSTRVRDLLTEIDGSESAKTDKVTWKFLKRAQSIRKQAITAKKFVLQAETLYLPVLKMLWDTRFQNTQPIKTTCPNCRFFITTHVKKISTIRTKLTSFVLAIIGFGKILLSGQRRNIHYNYSLQDVLKAKLIKINSSSWCVCPQAGPSPRHDSFYTRSRLL